MNHYLETINDSLNRQIDKREELYNDLFSDLEDLITLVAAEKSEASKDMCYSLCERYGIEVEWLQ